MKALLAAAKNQPALERFSGRWYKVILVPDLKSGDRFNVGVIYADQQGNLEYRFLSYYDRLRCLYGDAIEEQTRFMLQVLREQLTSEYALNTTPSQNLYIEGPFYASGQNSDVILKHLYNSVVPIGKAPNDTDHETAFASLNNQNARQLVYEQLDNLIGIDKTHGLIAQNQYLEFETTQGKRKLDVPLRPLGHYGSIVSACYKRRATIEKQILAARLELDTAFNWRPTNGKIGLFILRPSSNMHLTEKEIEATDAVLDELLWKMRSYPNWLIEADDNPKRLAEEIADWSEN